MDKNQVEAIKTDNQLAEYSSRVEIGDLCDSWFNLQTEIDQLKKERDFYMGASINPNEVKKLPAALSKITALEDVVEAAITAMRKRCERGHDHLCNSHVSIKHPCNCGHELLWEAIADCENLAKLEGRAARKDEPVLSPSLLLEDEVPDSEHDRKNTFERYKQESSPASPQPCKKCGNIGGGGKVYQEPCMALDSTPVIDCPECGDKDK